MTNQTFVKEFQDYDSAYGYMVEKNKALERAGNKVDTYCVVPGPEDDFAVVDLWTAIDLEMGYVWSYSGWVANPWTKC